jgi:hypothetical protein
MAHPTTGPRAPAPLQITLFDNFLRAHFIQGHIAKLLRGGDDDAKLAALSYLYGGSQTVDNEVFAKAFEPLKKSWLHSVGAYEHAERDQAERKRIGLMMHEALVQSLGSLSPAQRQRIEQAAEGEDFSQVKRAMQCTIAAMRVQLLVTSEDDSRELLDALRNGPGKDMTERLARKLAEERSGYVFNHPGAQTEEEAMAEFNVEMFRQCPDTLKGKEDAKYVARHDSTMRRLCASLSEPMSQSSIVDLLCFAWGMPVHPCSDIEKEIASARKRFMSTVSSEHPYPVIYEKAFRSRICAPLLAQLPEEWRTAYEVAGIQRTVSLRLEMPRKLLQEWKNGLAATMPQPAILSESSSMSSMQLTQPASFPALQVQPQPMGSQWTSAPQLQPVFSFVPTPPQPPMAMLPSSAYVTMAPGMPAMPVMVLATQAPALQLTPQQLVLQQFGVSLEEQNADPRWQEVGRRLCEYRALAPAQSATRKALLAENPDAVRAANIQTFSSESGKDSDRKAYQRTIRAGKALASAEQMRKVFSWDADHVSQNAGSLTPIFQSALYMETPFRLMDGNTVRLAILSPSAPFLANPGNPQWNLFVDAKARLRTDAYTEARKTISEQIRGCVAIANRDSQKIRRVVLSACGMGYALKGLDPQQQAKAQDIAVQEMAELIRELRKTGVEVAFTDANSASPFWKAVNTKLNSLFSSSKNVNYMGGIPGSQLQQGDLLVNASSAMNFIGDSDARSIDGAIGANSLCVDIHVFHAICWDVFKPQ